MPRRESRLIAAALMIAVIALASPTVSLADADFEALAPDEVVAAFLVEAVYETEAGNAMGARLRHLESGFVLDLLRIQSVPQAFMWVNSLPPSDQGEPHTLEHLLLGKGTRGQYVASLEDMSLSLSSAFTMQLRTCYHFHTAAGADVFYELLEAKLNAMIHPNFSDEEIRREVCNLGVSVDPADGSLQLEEKGTVYNEMVSSYERPWYPLSRKMDPLLYGKGHPMARESGGFPDSIRAMVPEDLWAFHRGTHHLNNMGMIISIPDDIRLADCLERVSAICKRVEPDVEPASTHPDRVEERLPEPRPAPFGTIELAEFPHENPDEPGLLIMSWPPLIECTNEERYVLDLLVDNIAGGETSDLYRLFIDSQTRKMDIGASSVFGWTTDDQGHPFHVGFNNVKPGALTVAKIDSIRGLVLDEIRRVAGFADGSEELRAFNERARNRVTERRREMRRFLNSPPGFGYRSSGAEWMMHLRHLDRTEGFKKSLSLEDELAFAEGLLAKDRNFWRDFIERWQLVERPPYAVGVRPDTGLIARTEAARQERLASATAELEQRYEVEDPEAAIRRFKEEYDAKTAEIDQRLGQIDLPKFLSSPPLTLDEQLRYTTESLPGGGTLVASTFENLTGATLGLAFRMDVVPEAQLVYAPALPILLRDVGVIRDGVPMAYDEMMEAIRREVLELEVYTSSNHKTGRVELVVRAAGTDTDETGLAIDWLETVLFDPDWRAQNLPRIRDAIDVSLTDLRNTMRRREEAWVNDPARAYLRQDSPLLLAAESFLTQTHALHRLRWLLKDAGTASVRDEFGQFMRELASASEVAGREELGVLLASLIGEVGEASTPAPDLAGLVEREAALSADARPLVVEAARDLRQSLAEVPDLSLAADWKYLCQEMTSDLAVSPEATLAAIGEVMGMIRKTDNVRAFLISNSAEQERVKPRLHKLLSRMDGEPSVRWSYATDLRIVNRMRDRYPEAGRPIFVGLVNRNTRSGVVINSAPCAYWLDYDRESLLRLLASGLYSGGGPHSMFMKTWGAGLAYSNGLRSSESRGRTIYYAERCPDLAQTIEFVVEELKNAAADTSLADYALAQVFSSYRAGSRYEQRGEAMAADLADGITPEVVREFRTRILELRSVPDLYEELRSRLEETYGPVLPGYGPRVSEMEGSGAISFIIGPEKQFESYESYLRRVEGDVPVYRLYPRDFWLTAQPAAERMD